MGNPFAMLFFEFVLPFLVPPILGAFVGFVLGLMIGRPRLGIVSGGIGGFGGAWLGIAAYWRWVVPNPSFLAFSVLVLTGAVLGAAILASLTLGLTRLCLPISTANKEH